MAQGHLAPFCGPSELKKPVAYYAKVLPRCNNRTPSAARFGIFFGSMFLYFTDWKVFMNKLPYYNRKFEEKEPLV